MNFGTYRQRIGRYVETTLDPNYIQNVTSALWNSATSNGITPLWNNVWNNWNNQNVKELVTLLVDISPEDRLFLQNEAQREIQSILTAKHCSIDLKLPKNMHDMVDTGQVTIIGAPDKVRDSYLEIRKLLPMTVWFDLKLNSNLPSIILDPNAQPLQDIQKRFEIAICVIPIQAPVIQATASNHISIYIRTNRGKEDNLKRGIDELTQFIESNNYGNIYPNMQTKIDVPTNRTEIIGRTYSMLDTIGAKTSTQISVQRSASNLMSNVSITGHDFPSVSSARTEINDRFVVELNFEVNAYQSKILANFGRQMERIGEEFTVHILMKPSLEPNHRTMIIRGTDKEVAKLFDVRQHIVALIQNPSVTPSATPIASQAINNNNNNIYPCTH